MSRSVLVVMVRSSVALAIPAPYMMGKKQIRAAELTCIWDEQPRGEDGPFVCTDTPVGR